ncbi:MAG: SBBP repeat-containing protein [Proteobacteria bacterium]|nr:SBBP repeat-containing protein [Pseudomonadota bacterium]MBU1059467.1 SBBP repeat-containing protein [Pseudomonadota bacterium]
MQSYSSVRSVLRDISILAISLFFLAVVLPVSLVHGSDGDFVWAKAIGAKESDRGHSIFIDTSGNIYTTGLFNGTVDFDPGPGIFNLTSAGTTNDIFISKFDSNGNLVWAKAIGGQLSCIGYGISVDTSGNVYTTGFFWGTVDFDPGPGIANLTSMGWSDIFISKLSSNGNFLWAKAIGGTLYDNGYAISLDSSGNVYTTGYFEGTVDFDPGPGIANLTSAGGNQDIFISKLSSNGDFFWAIAIGDVADDIGYAIAVDTSGNVYSTGFFQGTADFDPGPGTANLTSIGGIDIFISKLSSNGDFVWAKAMGGTSGGEGLGIAVDDSGNAYTTGYFTGTVDFDPGGGTFNLTSLAGSQDIFISKLSSNGDVIWAKAMGGTLNEEGYGISVDTSGNVYTTGFFQGTADFDPGTGSSDLTSTGWNDIFISKLSSNGDFTWAKAMGGTLDEYGKGIAVDTSGNTYITGYFYDTVDFNPGTGTFNLTADSDDMFIVHLSGSLSTFPWPMFLPAITGGP